MSLPQIQLGLHFPEYEFKEGDVVQLLKYDEWRHRPFIVVKRAFYDERPYSVRVEADSDEPIYTAWYYVVRALNPDSDGHHDRDAVKPHHLKEWKWDLSVRWEV
jgi:hypothetical protein